MKKPPPSHHPPRPNRQQLEQAAGKRVGDLIGPDLKVLFCGINPGLYSAAMGHHFARPGNRFWPALHLGGFTPRVLLPIEERELLSWGLGITNIAPRASAAADELTREELQRGARRLKAKVLRFRPRILAVLGVGAYRVGFERPHAKLGLQEDLIGETRVWVLPNPSGLNAHFKLGELGEIYARVRREIKG
jgi:double-stranded uracil-DNA glycosylase